MPAMTPEDLASAVEVFALEAIAWNQGRSADRIKAMEYYDGVMADTPSDKGRSSVVSRDFRAACKKVLPSITRTILGSDKVVEYQPVQQGDEEGAKQAEDYINYVVFPECHGDDVIRDAVHDALRIRNGIIKWWWDETKDVKTTKHSGLDEMSLVQLLSKDGGEIDEDIEILEQEQKEDGSYSVKIRRTVTQEQPRIACIPAEEFFINPDALKLEEAVFVAHNQKLKRYQLKAMGYDREAVDDLTTYTSITDQQAERTTRREDDDLVCRRAGRLRDMDEIDYWECFVRIDKDDDGISELRRIVMAGGWNAENILEDDECDEIPFADIVIERKPHEWEGRSLFDDISDIQRIKTVLLRSTLDNIYWQNNLQQVVQSDAIENMDAVLEPQFGKPIRVKSGYSVRDAVGHVEVPFVAQQAFDMLGYMDDALSDRTGITDAAGGLPPDALQNVTAKASAMMEQVGVSQIELMVRNVAVGLKRVFRGLLKLIQQHQDKPRTIRLRDNWVQFDPKSWNSDMDATVNVGLGSGTRERDMMAMQMVIGMQKEILLTMGAENPLVKPDQFYNGLAKFTQAAGIKNTSAFFTQPAPAEVQALLQKAASKPSPEEIKGKVQMQIEQGKAQTQMQIEQGKAQLQVQMEQQRMQVEASKEREQRDADLIVKQKELENNAYLAQQQIDAQDRREAMKMQLEREKMAQQRELELLKLNVAQQPDGSVKSSADTHNEAMMAVVQNMSGIADALRATVENMNKPKRVLRDPVTGKAMGMETVQ